MTDLIRMNATALVAALKKGDVSPLDCLDALEKRVDDVDAAVNALPTPSIRRDVLTGRAGPPRI